MKLFYVELYKNDGTSIIITEYAQTKRIVKRIVAGKINAENYLVFKKIAGFKVLNGGLYGKNY